MKWLRLSLRLLAGNAVLAAVVLAIYWHNPLWYWIEVHTGTVNEPGPFYGFWSGFGSDLGEVALFGAVIGGWHKVNCEVRGCWRIGRHKTAAGHSVCRHHHPDGAPTHADVIRAHHAAKESISDGRRDGT